MSWTAHLASLWIPPLTLTPADSTSFSHRTSFRTWDSLDTWAQIQTSKVLLPKGYASKSKIQLNSLTPFASSCVYTYIYAAFQLVAGLLGVESGQDAVIRALLYRKAAAKVHPYGITVADFTYRISNLRNNLGKSGLKDEGLVVRPVRGAEGKSRGNVLAGDKFSLAYARKPEEILRIVYGGGSERNPGGFYPQGANGRIARSFLQKSKAF